MSDEYKNYYQLLGLGFDAAEDEISVAYRRVILETERDGQTDRSSIDRAYEVLSNPQRRQLYDSLLAEIAAPPLVPLTQVSSQNIQLLDEPQTVYMLVEIKSPEQKDQDLLPLNLSLVIDCSTSMQGKRLKLVKKALQMLLEKLTPGDMLSVVSFNDRAEVILPVKHIGEHQKPVKMIKSIEASGGTEIYQGLLAGWQQMHQVPLEKSNNQLILLTDGRTYGDASQCIELAQRVAGEGITFNAFGIGTDWDDRFLDALVSPSGGLVEFIDAPESIVSALEKRVKGMGTIFGRNVRLRSHWPGRIELLDGFRLTPFARPLDTNGREISLGNVEGYSPLTFLLEFSVSAHPIPARIRVPLAFLVDIQGKGEQAFSDSITLEIKKDVPQVDPPEDIVRAVRLLTMYRLGEKAWQYAESGQLSEAAKRMNYLSTRLLESGHLTFARQVNLEGQRLAREEQMSAEGRMRLKYGTRSLIGKSFDVNWDDSMPNL